MTNTNRPYGSFRPLMPTPPAEGEDLATFLQNCGTWLIEIGYASEQVNTRDMGIKVVRAAALLQILATIADELEGRHG